MISFQVRKVDEIHDGCVEIQGIATAEETDRDGERLDYEKSKPFFQRWMDAIRQATDGKSWGNIRAQHDSQRAVGVVKNLTFDDVLKRIFITCRIVDEDTTKKILAGVYSAFSIAGRYLERYRAADGVTNYVCDPCEISVVDFPCLPSATFEIVSKAGAVERRSFQQKGASNMNSDHVQHCLTAASHHDAQAESHTKQALGLRKAAAECDKSSELHKAQAAELRKMAAASPFHLEQIQPDKSAHGEFLQKVIAAHDERDPTGGIGRKL